MGLIFDSSVLVYLERNLQQVEKIISIWANSVKRGTRIGSHDLMIGATCISLGFPVITSDIRDFERIPGLKVEEFLN
jgi:tRNA(fMet)-specific endonuclease VapC